MDFNGVTFVDRRHAGPRGARWMALCLLALACGGEGSTGPEQPRDAPLEIVFGYSLDPSPTPHLFDLFVASADGRTVRPFLSLPDAERDPAWSPDGERLAFTATLPLVELSSAWLADASDGSLASLAPGFTWNATWSPDGTSLVFMRRATNLQGIEERGLAVIRADGYDLRWLSDSTMGDTPDPASWSPDGRIAFARLDETGGSAIWTIDDAGASAPVQLTAGPRDRRPQWSRDGATLAFVATATEPGGPPASDIVLVDADGSSRRVLVTGGENSDPAWSPDGSWLLFARTDRSSGMPRCQFYKVQVTGGTPAVVAPAQPTGECAGASWR
jgi:Tol biopolymer transport system component